MKINNINSYLYKTKESVTKKTNKDTPEKPINKDVFDSLTYKNGTIDFKHLTNLTLESLKNSYKDINIFIGTLKDKDVIREYAKLSNGKNLIISSEFIEKMKTDSESYDKGKTILEEILKQLSASEENFKSIGAYVDEKGVTYWSTFEKPKEENQEVNRLIESMKKMKQEMDQIKDKFKVKVSNSMFNSPAEVYTKLSQASTVPEVKSAVSLAEYKIYALKAALGSCEKQERNKIKAAIAQLEKAVSRAGGKVKDLNKEGDMKSEHKKAKILNQLKKAEKIKIELERQKAMRRSREVAQIDEGKVWSYYPEELIGNKNLEITEQEINTYYPEVMGDMDINASGEIGISSDVGSVEVNVCETVEISF